MKTFKDFLNEKIYENSDYKEVQKVLKREGIPFKVISSGINHGVTFTLGSLVVKYEKNFVDVYKSKRDMDNDKEFKFFNRLDDLIDFYYSL